MTFTVILTQAPTPPLQLNPNLLTKLEEIVNKTLEKDQNLRYQYAGDIRVASQSTSSSAPSSRPNWKGFSIALI